MNPSRLLVVRLVEGDDLEGVKQPDDELASGPGRQGQDMGVVGVGLPKFNTVASPGSGTVCVATSVFLKDVGVGSAMTGSLRPGPGSRGLLVEEPGLDGP